jgi:class 3 adenylate cyclase
MLGARLFTRSEGNPFVVEETVKDSLDRGDIFRDGTKWRGRGVGDFALPESVVDTILARLGRLRPDYLEVLRAASIMGHGFDLAILVGLTAREVDEVRDALRVALAEQLISEDAGQPGRFRFRHALTREAVYQDMMQPDREALHARAAEVLLDLREVSAAERAHHLLAAGRWGDAVPVCLEAAAEAMSRRGAAEAVELYQKALPLVHDAIQRGELLCHLGTAYWWSAKPELAMRPLADGLELLAPGTPRASLAPARLTLGRVLEELQRNDEAAEQYEIVKEAIGAENGRTAAEVRVRLADVHMNRLEAHACRLLAEEAARIARESGDDDVRLEAQLFVGVATAATGSVGQGLASLEESYREARRSQMDTVAAEALARSIIILHWSGRVGEAQVLARQMASLDAGPWIEYRARYWTSYLEAYGGDLARAAEGLEELRDSAREWGMRRWVGHAEDELANIYVDLDQLEDAAAIVPATDPGLSRFQELVILYTRLRLATARGVPESEIDGVRALGRLGPISPRYVLTVEAAVELALSAGEKDLAEAVIANATKHGGYQGNPWFTRAQARIASSARMSDEAVELLDAARNGFRSGGYPLEEARTLLLLGEVLAAAGQRQLAVARLSEAVAGAAACAAVRVGRLAAAGLRQLGVTVEPDRPSPRSGARSAPQPLGEQYVTVVFADVRGFTRMTALEAPEEMSARMSAFYRWARREVERRDGVIDEFRGDSVMATFNAEGKTLGHGQSAVEAAVALRDKAALMHLELGTGISVGPAVVGSDEKGGLTVIGEVANRAARLQAEAAGGEILLDEEALRRARQWLQSEGHMTSSRVLALKGIDEPVRAAVISKAGPSRDRG